MGGGAMNIDLPMIQFKTSSSNLPSPSSSSLPSNLNFPVPANHRTGTAPLKQSCTASYCTCNCETCTRLEYVNKRPSGSFNNLVFGSVPSQSEVENAITALQNFIHGISTSGPPELKWLQPVLDCCDVRALLLSQGSRRVYDAFRLLLTEPSVKRLVVSLSSDKAVWDAVLKNELVQKLRESLYPAEIGRPQSSDDETDLATTMLRWILDITRTKVMELIDKFQSLVNEVFHPLRREKPTAETADNLEEQVMSSLLLSVVILLIVIVARAHRA